MSYFVYIIRSISTRRFYTGITNNLERRLREHNRPKSNTIVTKYLRDFKLVYSEKLKSRQEARKREKYLKSGIGREFRDRKIKEYNKRV